MRPLARLISSTARTAAGAALGVALMAGLLASAPLPAHAQDAPAPASSPAPTSQVAPGERGAALWVVRDADSTIYLFGTVHVLRPETRWESPQVAAAFASADDVWFEISNPDDQAALIPLVQRYGMGPEPLSHQITSGQLTLLDQAARTIGASALQLDGMRPWLAGLTLSVAPLAKAGYDPASGVELVLKARAEAAGKTVHGFETLDQQVRMLATLPQPIQLEFLKGSLEAFEDATTELDGMVAAWSRGDVAALEAVAVDPMKAETPAIHAVLLADRNKEWAGQIQTLLEGSGVAFVAVGAAHLAGEDSVQSVLQSRGVTVERQ